MGMFDKDKEIGNRIDTEFDLHEDFILWHVVVDEKPVTTKIGDARKTLLTVSRLDEPDVQFECATLGSAIADKAEQAVPDDFPCVVQLRHVAGRFKSEALVLQFVRPWKV